MMEVFRFFVQIGTVTAFILLGILTIISLVFTIATIQVFIEGAKEEQHDKHH